MNVSTKATATKAATAAAKTTNTGEGAGALAATSEAAPTIIKPTVGRRVHYFPNEADQASLSVFDAQQPCGAGITYVWGDRTVNLEVTGPSGAKLYPQNVRLLQEGDDHVEGESYAAWMPYQTKKAATEAVSD